MTSLSLQYPVFTLDHQWLFPAGALVTGETLEAVVRSRGTGPIQTHSLLDEGLVKEDCSELLSVFPYAAIFAGKKQIDAPARLETPRFLLPSSNRSTISGTMTSIPTPMSSWCSPYPAFWPRI